jgi:cysteine desulfurase
MEYVYPVPIYLDNAATTPCLPEVIEIVVRCLGEDFGNPSSAHRLGLAAAARVKHARAQLIEALGEGQIVFTSGGTEANALAILGAARRGGKPCSVVVSAVEHPSVQGAAEKAGRVVTVPVGADGVVSPEDVAAAVGPDTAVVALMLVQNEIGTIQPVMEAARRARARNDRVHIHCDAVQAIGKIPVSARALGVDSLAVSAHKIHGPKGAGALWLRKGVTLAPLWTGGGQEGGLRSGTENVPGIAGLGEAVARAIAHLDADAARMAHLRDRLVATLVAATGAKLNGGSAPRAPHIASLSLPGVPAEPLLHAIEERGVYVSAGSACHSNGPHNKKSHVLQAIGVPDGAGTIRVSLSRLTTSEEVDAAEHAIIGALRDLVQLLP